MLNEKNKNKVKYIFYKLGIDYHKIRKFFSNRKKTYFIENVANTNFSKNCLLKYITDPFFISDKQENHQNMWQVRQIVKELIYRGYNVDVLDFCVQKVNFNKQYDMLIDIQPKSNDVYGGGTLKKTL